MGKVLVLPVASPEEGRPAAEPVLLLVINATTDGVEWGELQLKVSSSPLLLENC